MRGQLRVVRTGMSVMTGGRKQIEAVAVAALVGGAFEATLDEARESSTGQGLACRSASTSSKSACHCGTTTSAA